MRILTLSLLVGVSLSGCASTSLNTALGTPKNPTTIYADPSSKYRDDQDVFILANYNVLLEAIDFSGDQPRVKTTAGVDMRRYLAAGYNLADTYCSRYFTKTDEAYRRRRFGRTLTNDAGTAASTVLGIAGASQGIVTALAAATGLADSAWRNYDDSFVITPELATVRSLVQAAQDNYRARTLGKDADLPADFGTAHSTIRRYSELCSHLGMKSLLEQSAGKEKQDLSNQTAQIVAQEKTGTGAGTVVPHQTPAPTTPAPSTPSASPVTALPALTPNTARSN